MYENKRLLVAGPETDSGKCLYMDYYQSCIYSETWTSRTAGDHQKSLSYGKFELRIMFSFCFSHVTIVASPFHSGVFRFLTKLSKTCEIFTFEKKTIKLSLLHKNVNTSSHRKGKLMTLTAVYQFELWLKVRDMPTKLLLPRQGPWTLVWVKQVFELSEVEVIEFHCIRIKKWEKKLIFCIMIILFGGMSTAYYIQHS